MMKKLVLLVALILFVFSPNFGFSQCAMCKAVAETSSEGAEEIGQGLNVGIVYLMFFPYLLIGIISYAWYRHNKKNKQAAQ
ncbi:MAG: hypothetical protein LAT76_06230 [Schleiferiaceae bacterium]|nr:hypothetical protein [Schleiferiaceae bacterium]